ncbi:MAG: alkene reductase [Pseudomonadota bacterium]
MPSLFDTLTLGDLTLNNRVIMAPLTRMRSQQPGNIPWEMNAEYYAQRASAGLIIAEATQISPQGQGYPATPGIYSSAQVAGWRLVTDAVHAKGGKIFLQLWHVGRVSHSSLQPNGELPVAPSAIAPEGMVMNAQWKQVPYETPRALETREIAGIVEDYKRAAENAQAAGFDGVEVHAANGYLLNQFLEDGTNTRDDHYGGSIENRARLLLQVVDAVSVVWGRQRVGVRLSPYGTFASMGDSDPLALYTYVLERLSEHGIAYAHVIEPRASNAGSGGQEASQEQVPSTSKLFRAAFKRAFISAGGYDAQSAPLAIENGDADAVAFGRLFIANPDLPERLEVNAPLNPYDRATFYGGTEKGYVDYPPMQEKAA